PKPAPDDVTALLQLRYDACHSRGRNVEGDTNRAARRRIDRGVDANHFAFEVERRPTRVATVYGRVDLDVIVIRARADVAALRRADPGRYGAAKPEGVAHRHHPFANLGLGAGQLDEREIRVPIDLDERQVALGIGAHDLCIQGCAGIGNDLDLDRVIDDV